MSPLFEKPHIPAFKLVTRFDSIFSSFTVSQTAKFIETIHSNILLPFVLLPWTCEMLHCREVIWDNLNNCLAALWHCAVFTLAFSCQELTFGVTSVRQRMHLRIQHKECTFLRLTHSGKQKRQSGHTKMANYCAEAHPLETMGTLQFEVSNPGGISF